jgi:hypothetical protein
MKTLTEIQIEAHKLYMQLELGPFFNTYHDWMYDLLQEIDYLEEDDEEDYKTAEDILTKCKALIKAQKILLTANLN